MAASYNLADFTRAQYIEAFVEYSERHHRDPLLQIISHPDPSLHFALNINALEFLDSKNHIGALLLANPRFLLPLFDEALVLTTKSICHTTPPTSQPLVLKEHIHARLSNLPLCPELTRYRVPLSVDVGRFLAFRLYYVANLPKGTIYFNIYTNVLLNSHAHFTWHCFMCTRCS
jgi:hypothetical protein